jgi:hypothetical protein
MSAIKPDACRYAECHPRDIPHPPQQTRTYRNTPANAPAPKDRSALAGQYFLGLFQRLFHHLVPKPFASTLRRGNHAADHHVTAL